MYTPWLQWPRQAWFPSLGPSTYRSVVVVVETDVMDVEVMDVVVIEVLVSDVLVPVIHDGHTLVQESSPGPAIFRSAKLVVQYLQAQVKHLYECRMPVQLGSELQREAAPS